MSSRSAAFPVRHRLSWLITRASGSSSFTCTLAFQDGARKKRPSFVTTCSDYWPMQISWWCSAISNQVRIATSDTYAEWAAQLRQHNDWQAALDKYQTLLNQYGDTPSGQQAANWMAKTSLAWGDQASAATNYFEWMRAGTLTMRIDKTFPLAQAPEAQRYLSSR
jgi:TolA-binding protein